MNFEADIEYIEEKGKLHRGEKANSDFSDYLAVLDGQQRLTSLYIGTCGKEHLKKKGKRWDDPDSFEDKYLCIDVIFVPKEKEDKYSFKFCTVDEIEKLIVDEEGDKHFWIKVNTVYNSFGSHKNAYLYIEELNVDYFDNNKNARLAASDILTELEKALTVTQNISYFPAKNMDLSEVVDIFVRVNSGGEKLGSSDLMLSVAAGEISDKDVHVILQDAVNEINNAPNNPETGFVMDKETLLTAGLMFTDAESLYLSKSSNYTHERI